METREWRHLPRKDYDGEPWVAGPWDDEPDKVQWSDPETGLPCLAVRNDHGGNWCGYVGVTEGHPYFEVDGYDHEVDVHGGVTFTGFCREGAEEHGICHVPGPGEPARVWWLGFDCAHCWDVQPGRIGRDERSGFGLHADRNVYRDLDYVKSQCALLAKQLAAMESKR